MAPAHRTSGWTHFTYSDSDVSDELPDLNLSRGDRIGTPISRRRGRSLGKALVLLLVVGGLGWAAFGAPPQVREWWSQTASGVVGSIKAAVEASTAGNTRAPDMVRAPPATEVKLTALETAAPIGADSMAGEPAQRASVASSTADVTTGSLPAGHKSHQDAATQRPPSGDLDPLQRSAEAVGLHPDISRVLLARLSPADFQNAKIAIETALAEMHDDGELTFPRKREKNLAVFRVHFVAGAGADCRRYVVTVAKDGWLTTALPMEKCGVRQKTARRE
jgi:hypothetical protein